jgi:mediator of RNA polymerase II transcription subunit 12
MTSARPPAGIQRQPPQRSLSGTGLIQRPTPNRALSQQYQPSSSPRKTETYVDLTLEGSETALGRYGTPSRVGGSRLKLEISKDAARGANIAIDSPKVVDVPTETPFPVVIRGRPKLHFVGDPQQLGGASQGAPISSVRGGENVIGHVPLPMPRRPGQNAQSSIGRDKLSTPRAAVKKDVRPKPYTLETPSLAPRYPPNGKIIHHLSTSLQLTNFVPGHADFFPWTGNHPEDQFTDHVIRQGFFDKTQTTQNETGSARMSIFPALKHKSGLQTLSSLFTNILAQRRAHGQITAPPTFKPPPRVTLTDTKREAWLRDLANPTISLRRLSRTIPHGIRNKILLEQCLSKNIPTERAVWLAKCVGANEIRSFKRKGVTGTFAMGNEAKWIREWTTHVEQFVESLVSSCGEKDWKDRILYA